MKTTAITWDKHCYANVFKDVEYICTPAAVDAAWAFCRARQETAWAKQRGPNPRRNNEI